MLTRLYIDNYKCFSNFELKLEPLQLLLGDNGTGKSSVLDVVAGLQALLVGEPIAQSGLGGSTLTRWDRRTRQTFELDVQPPGMDPLQYRLELEVDPRGTTLLARESLSSGGRPIFSDDGDVALLFESAENPIRGFVDRRHSGIAMSPRELPDMEALKTFMSRVVVLRPWPTGMKAASTEEDFRLDRHASNFGAWYRWHDPEQSFDDRQSFHQHLTSVLSGFRSLHFTKTGSKERVLSTLWNASTDEQTTSFDLSFDEISDGQRMLVLLYALSSYKIKGQPLTVLLDEPTNFVSLAEIEPWLHTIEEHSEAARQVLVVSHNPEVLDAWAGAYGIQFDREAAGPVRARRLTVADDDPLTPSERIARGWDDGNG